MSDSAILWLRPPKGKVSVRREQIAQHLRPRGFEITLVDATAKNLASAAWKLVGGDYDVVIGNVRAGLYAGYPMAAMTATPFIADVSDPISDIAELPPPIFRLLERYESWILRRVSETVYVPQVYRTVTEAGYDGRVAPNAVDFEKFADPDPAIVDQCGSILRDEGVELSQPIGLYVGVLSDGRNIETILETASLVPDWQIVIVGEGELSPTVRQAVADSDNVFWPGAFDHDLMPGFMSHATIGFCLVDIERPIKIVEYGAAGLPVLGLPGKLQRDFSDEQICFVEPTSEAIAEKLRQLATDPEQMETYADKLRDDAKEHSWSAVADVYEKAINSVLNRSGV